MDKQLGVTYSEELTYIEYKHEMTKQNSNSYPDNKYGIHKYIKCIITICVKRCKTKQRKKTSELRDINYTLCINGYESSTWYQERHMPSQTSPGGREHCKGLKGSSLKTMVGCTISLDHLGKIQKA